MPLELFIELVGLVKKREYSISSAEREGYLGITVGLTEHFTPSKRLVKGTCSTYLIEAKEGSKLRFKVEKGQISSISASTDTVLVATGTGIAPFRGFILDRMLDKASGLTWLFYGCRWRKGDYLYGEEFEELSSKSDTKFKLNPVFSRDQAEKNYVHHEIERNGKELLQVLLKNKGKMIVVGGAKTLPNSIELSFTRILEKEGVSAEEAKRMFSVLKQKKQIIFENW